MNSVIDSCHSRSSLTPTVCSTGKGSHIAALRSLGLLHELQEHVATLQQTAAEQEKELTRLKAQKREAERMGKREPCCNDNQPIMQQFQRAEVVDLPPKLRALFEDNKVLKEEVRRYKCRARELEQTAATQQQQLAKMQAQVEKYKQQVAEGAASPEALAAEELARQQVDSAAKALQKLQEAHRILQQKLEADARSHKQALSAAARGRQQLEQQVAELQQQLDAKDKEARASNIAAKKIERRLQELKSAAAEAAAGVTVALANAVAGERARQKQLGDASIHLMLCILKESSPAGDVTSQKTGQHQQQQVAVTNAGDACLDQGGLSPLSTTAQVHADQGCNQQARYTREQAVRVIQAATRGHIARKQLKAQRELEEHAVVVIQAGTQTIGVCKQSAVQAEQHPPPLLQQALLTGADGSSTTLLTIGTRPDVSSSNTQLQAAMMNQSNSIHQKTSGSDQTRSFTNAASNDGIATADAGIAGCGVAGAELSTPVDSLPMELPRVPTKRHTAAGGPASTTSAPGSGCSVACPSNAHKQANRTAAATPIRARTSAPPTGRSVLPASLPARTATTSPRAPGSCSRVGSRGPGSSTGLETKSNAQEQQQLQQKHQKAASRQRL